jgi:Flp pilus assembly protein TadD
MTAIYRITRLGALAIGVACCLVGCQQLPMNAAPTSGGYSSASSAPDGKLTRAQQADMQIAMGRVSERQGDLAAAMASYGEAVKRDGSRSDAYVRMAVVHDRQGEFRESADLYGQALKLSPGSPDIYCDMGYSLYLQRRWAEAEMNLRQAIALDNKHARAHNNLALVLAQNGHLNDALSEFHKGGSNGASAHANLAFVLTMERRWDEARDQYKLALAADPSSTELQIRLQQLDTLAAKLQPSREKVAGTQDARVMTASADIAQQSRRPPVVSAPTELPVRNSSPRPTTQSVPKEAQRPSGGRPSVHIPPPIEFRAAKTAQTESKLQASSKPVIPPPRIRVQQPAQPRTDDPAHTPSVAPAAINVPSADSAPNRAQASQSSPIPPLESAR